MPDGVRPGAPEAPEASEASRAHGEAGLRRLGQELRRRSSSTEAGAGADAAAGGSRQRSGRAIEHRPRRRRWPRRTLIVVNVVTALAILGVGGAYAYAQWRLGQIKRIPVAGLHPQGRSSQSASDGAALPPFTMLVIGSDTRDLGSGGSAAFGNETTVSGQRSDSIILVRVVPKTRSLALLSIPRDTLVPIPGYGTTRINTAFNSGSPSLLVTVLDQDFGIQVNHVAVFNFDTFRDVADAVGGVEQYFPTPAKDAYSDLEIPKAGCYNLTGNRALAFVRSREYEYYLDGQWQYQLYPESDLARIQRQQAFFRDLVKKAKQVAPTNPFTLNAIIGGVTKNLTLDNTFSNSTLLDLAEDFRSANVTTIPSYTYPTQNSTEVAGALDPETQQGQAVIQQWLDVGQTAPSTVKSATPARKPVITVNPSSVSIAVENGSGIGGQAAQAGQDLTDIGYNATVSGDAPTFGLATTEIEYAPDSLAAAKQLQSQLVGTSTLVLDDALAPTVYNLELVTGQNYNGVIGSSKTPASAETTTTIGSPAYEGTATVNPASSSIYKGVYIPPGLQPGQVPQTCGE
jgi:polyisoprenyl-teichoic acid--peptidoglycan teichoic acid transferase